MRNSVLDSWPKQNNKAKLNATDNLQEKMQAYCKLKSKDVRSARKFLRSVGLEINSKGTIVCSSKEKAI